MNEDERKRLMTRGHGRRLAQMVAEGWADDEILEDYRWNGETLGLHDRRIFGQLLAEMRGAASETPESVRGPSPSETVTLAALEKVRVALCSQGKHHGYDVLSRELGVSRSTVVRRYRGRTTPGDTHIPEGRHH